MLEFRLRISSPGWRQSGGDVYELPNAAAAGTGTPADRLLLVAGGLALVLSRCPPNRARHVYPNAYRVYKMLRSGIEGGVTDNISPGLLLDTMHEVAERLDPVSKHALRECLEWKAARPRAPSAVRPAGTGAGAPH